MFFINPGAGAVRDANMRDAEEAFERFAKEVGAESYTTKSALDDDGRLEGTMRRGDHEVVVHIPGVPKERLQAENVWHQPRLFVDGDSWLWQFAVKQARDVLQPGWR